MRIALLVSLGVLCAAVSGEAAVDDWVGAERCGSCHPQELRAWKRGPHRGAFKSIASAGATRRQACASCHNTGDAPAGTSDLLGVQCEACHGPGRHYAVRDIMQDAPLAHALGLRNMATASERTAVCMRCHEATTSLRPFDVEKAWAEIAH